MFKYIITIKPLGMLYGSAGAFLSPENLVGRSGAKFPPDAATVSGLFFSVNKHQEIADHELLKYQLHVAGPFWARQDDPESFYVPIPRHRIIAKSDEDEWRLDDQRKWQRDSDPQKQVLEAEYRWQRINAWTKSTRKIRTDQEVEEVPWQYVSFLHPQMQVEQRHVLEKDGLFLESAVQMDEDACLVYLSTHALPDGWYRFGGEGHMVEVASQEIDPESRVYQLLNTKIQRAFALIVPGVWGSKNLSYRYPKHPDFPREGIKILTDKPLPYRYRTGHRATERGRLGRGRYAVPAGTVYVLKRPLEKTWWEFPDEWFPKEGFPLKHLGCGLCLPIEVQGIA